MVNILCHSVMGGGSKQKNISAKYVKVIVEANIYIYNMKNSPNPPIKAFKKYPENLRIFPEISVFFFVFFAKSQYFSL